ncbi:response regulator transcription factor [Luteolibacter yonseiensis]|uniref:Response regulator transcription factor n=1 Tax=Luteolibacter yonseiensis TaxID=1144680 RepID=A0A934VAG1_9BACT|nr:LuxR C-terminal-related transcriptional regulator [Luteolibacter yonseiensis]MBK1815120.1 response regulator transcription factor [Luteolibacter yonseiensis]
MHLNAQPEQLVHYIHEDGTLPTLVSRQLRDAGLVLRPYSSATEMLEAQRSVLRGCFVLDVHTTRGLGGLEIQAELIRRNDHLPVIFLTDHGTIPNSVLAIKRGAADFLTRQTTAEVLLATITKAMAREAQTWNLTRKGMDLKHRWQKLTPSERKVFSCVVSGMTNKQIGGRLGSTERTIRAHRASLMEKMAAGSIAELVHQAHDLGLPVDPA